MWFLFVGSNVYNTKKAFHFLKIHFTTDFNYSIERYPSKSDCYSFDFFFNNNLNNYVTFWGHFM